PGGQRTASSAIAAVMVAATATLAAQAPSKTKAHVQTLASQQFEGRLAGSNGEKLASEYIAAELQRIGTKPLPGRSDLLMPFELPAGTRDGGCTIGWRIGSDDRVCGGVAGSAAGPGAGNRGGTAAAECVRALSFSDNGDAEGAVVFAGYGIVV